VQTPEHSNTHKLIANPGMHAQSEHEERDRRIFLHTGVVLRVKSVQCCKQPLQPILTLCGGSDIRCLPDALTHLPTMLDLSKPLDPDIHMILGLPLRPGPQRPKQ